MENFFSVVGGPFLAIVIFLITEYRHSRRVARQRESVQDATALLAYEKLRLEVIHLVRDQVPAADVEHAVRAIGTGDQTVEKSPQVPDIPWPRMRRYIAIVIVLYALALIVVSVRLLATGTNNASAVAGVVAGAGLLGFFVRWIANWRYILEKFPPRRVTPKSDVSESSANALTTRLVQGPPPHFPDVSQLTAEPESAYASLPKSSGTQVEISDPGTATINSGERRSNNIG